MTSISLITCSWNSAETLPETLASVRKQGGLLEHVLVDGGSSDGTIPMLEAYAQEDLPYQVRWSSEPDQGIYDAMNKGIARASGEVVGILNADDLYTNDQVLARIGQVFDDPDVDICYGDLVYFRRKNGEEKLTRYWRAGPYKRSKLFAGWMPPHPSVFVRRELYERLGVFRLDLGTAADYELLLRFLLQDAVCVRYVPQVLVRMRVGGASTASLGNRLRAHRMDRKAWEVNRQRPHPWTLPMKPLRKVPQWFQKHVAVPRPEEGLDPEREP